MTIGRSLPPGARVLLEQGVGGLLGTVLGPARRPGMVSVQWDAGWAASAHVGDLLAPPAGSLPPPPATESPG